MLPGISASIPRVNALRHHPLDDAQARTRTHRDYTASSSIAHQRDPSDSYLDRPTVPISLLRRHTHSARPPRKPPGATQID